MFLIMGNQLPLVTLRWRKSERGGGHFKNLLEVLRWVSSSPSSTERLGEEEGPAD